MSESPLMPLFLDLEGRQVVLVGGGTVATAKLGPLVEAGARILVVAPEIAAAIALTGVELRRRPFLASDLDSAWLVVAAAPPEVNAEVARAARARRIFCIAADDPRACTAYGAGVVRRGGVTLAISTRGAAPALAGLLREAFDAILPAEIGEWVALAEALRDQWRALKIAFPRRRPLLLEALVAQYEVRPAVAAHDGPAPVCAVDVQGPLDS